jgi:hypothetical protein
VSEIDDLRGRVAARVERLRLDLAERALPSGFEVNRVGRLPEMEGAMRVWMHPVEWSQVACLLSVARPARVLEWGAGGSSHAFLERGPFIERHLSIEHHPGWAEEVRRTIRDPRFEIVHIEPSVPEPPEDPSDPQSLQRRQDWADAAELDPTVFEDYVAYPSTRGERFDFVLVDGRARVHCLRAGWELLEAGGLLLLHDAQRPIYHSAMAEIGPFVFLEPWQQGQVAFLRKPADGS